MKRETYESQKAFAGEKKPSMLRRCVGHDYTKRMMYMVTMVTEGRRPLFGTVVGHSDATTDSDDVPRVELTPLGQRVHDEWWGIPRYYPQVEIIALQMMPDHLHGIIFIKEKMEKDLSRIIRGFKTGCHRAYRELFPDASVPSSSVPFVATESQQTRQPSSPLAPSTPSSHPAHGFLFAPGFNDKLLLRQGQLQRWLDYLHDNPRRLLIKREHPDFFRVQRDLTIAGQQFSAIGNRFLLDRPVRLQVQCSRRLTEQQSCAISMGIIAEAFKSSLDVMDNAARLQATQSLLDEVDWSETSSYKQGLTRHWTEMFCQDMPISQTLIETLTLAAGVRGGISTGGGGSCSELTNWDGTKKKTGWGLS